MHPNLFENFKPVNFSKTMSAPQSFKDDKYEFNAPTFYSDNFAEDSTTSDVFFGLIITKWQLSVL
jgi:hypothetical protein